MVDFTSLLVSLLKRCCRIVAILRIVTLNPFCHPEAKPKDLNALDSTGAMPTLAWACEMSAQTTCLPKGKHGTHHPTTADKLLEVLTKENQR